MSINSTTINACTIDALCGDRRTVTIAYLQSLLPQTGKGHPQKVNPDTSVDLSIFRRRPQEEEDIDLSTFEQDSIRVTVSLGGVEYGQTLSRKEGVMPVINVYDLTTQVSDRPSIAMLTFNYRILDGESVTLSDLLCQILDESVSVSTLVMRVLDEPVETVSVLGLSYRVLSETVAEQVNISEFKIKVL